MGTKPRRIMRKEVTSGDELEMKATLQIELQPFQTPNFVRVVGTPGLRQDGMKELTCYPLSDLDPMTLDKLCRDFRDEVFRKAGKEPPLAVNAERN